MKTFLSALPFCFILASSQAFAQGEPSCGTVPPAVEPINPTETHGIYLPAQGDLKILVVFARFKDDTSPHPDWPVGGNPYDFTTWIDPHDADRLNKP
jgi:hypothetical protein